MVKRPLFTIIIPCYNHASWLKSAVNSVLTQDFDDWELIIVNDGSTDESLNVANELQQKDQRIIIVSQLNQGLSSARNAGLKHSSGLWINFMDADDYYNPGCLSGIKLCITKFPNADMFQSSYDLVDENNMIIRFKEYNNSNGTFINEVIKGNIGPPLSIFIKKERCSIIGAFNELLTSAEDWDYWLRAAKSGALRVVLDKRYVSYRYTVTSMSRNPWQMYFNIDSVIATIPLKDSRISVESVYNIDRSVNITDLMKQNLIQCTGLAITQGKIIEALYYFKNECSKFSYQFLPSDMLYMCSYLNFKDLYSDKDIKKIFNEYLKSFKTFFSQTAFSYLFQKTSFFFIFKRHLKYSLVKRMGLLGKGIYFALNIMARLFSTKYQRAF